MNITFYPVGNGDTCFVKLDKKTLLFDFAALHDSSNPDDLRIDLPNALKIDIGSTKKEIDVVAFTHLDDDHVHGASEFFHLDHAEKYQGDGRVVIKELWVPAAAITEEGAEDDARIIRQEARHRLRKGSGVRVFSRPAHLEEWLKKEGLSLASRQSLITGAGELVPNLNKDSDGIEVFVHSPFAEQDGDTVLDRNENSLVFQLTFKPGNTHMLLAADTDWENLERIVKITRLKRNDDRLKWDIYKIPHHCSYLSLNAEKGKTETVPNSNVAWLIESCANERAIMVSSSQIISDKDEDQPPHFQAKNCYKKKVESKSGKFIVTMEHPNRTDPKRLVINITPAGASIGASSSIGSGAAITSPAPRVG